MLIEKMMSWLWLSNSNTLTLTSDATTLNISTRRHDTQMTRTTCVSVNKMSKMSISIRTRWTCNVLENDHFHPSSSPQVPLHVKSSGILAARVRCFSRYVFGDGAHTDVFSWPKSTQCPIEPWRETSEHCENEGHSTKNTCWETITWETFHPEYACKQK